MADTKISAESAAAALGGTEVVPGVQSAANVKITATQIKTFTSASPTLVTPVLGVATATSINKVALTAPASSATLTLIDGTTVTGPAATGTIATLAGSETFTNKTLTSPTLTTPVLGTPSSGTLTSCTGHPKMTTNAQTGTTYTVLSSDVGHLTTFSNASAIAVTLPQATGSFAAGSTLFFENKGAGTATITPTTSTIDGSATLALTQNQGVVLVSDGTNYSSMRGIGGAGGGTPGGSNTQFQYNNSGAFAGSAVTTSDLSISSAGMFGNSLSLGVGSASATLPLITGLGLNSTAINEIKEYAVQKVSVFASNIRFGWSSSTETDASTLRGAFDTGLARNAAAVVEVNTGTAGTFADIKARTFRNTAVAFASAAGTPVEGMTQAFTDSSTATWGATITGGGANHVLGYYNGTNWTVMAK